MFKTKRFGLFIHWGLYSVSGLHEQEMWRYGVKSKEYEKYVKQFNPTEYNPKEWVSLAKNCGFDYITFTTKHHDGFCMWDSKYTDYKITNTPYGKDVLKMLSEECEKQGVGRRSTTRFPTGIIPITPTISVITKFPKDVRVISLMRHFILNMSRIR